VSLKCDVFVLAAAVRCTVCRRWEQIQRCCGRL